MRRPGYLGDIIKNEYRNGELRRVVVDPRTALKYLDLAAAGISKEVPYGTRYARPAPKRDIEVDYIPEYMRYSKIFPNLPVINPTPLAKLRDPMTFNTLLI